MIKCKIYKSNSYIKVEGNIRVSVSDYYYNIYLLGFLIKTLTIKELEHKVARKIFGNKIIQL